MFKRIGLLLLAAIIGAFCLELGERYSIPGVDASSLVPKPRSAAP